MVTTVRSSSSSPMAILHGCIITRVSMRNPRPTWTSWRGLRRSFLQNPLLLSILKPMGRKAAHS
uniref:Uncharacterized protein n=2 Tax=Anguilla anguilla TaxID=7936 RepID=A0A0E9XZ60_ANGAN